MNARAHQLRALAVAAQCDPRTAARFLAGLSVSPMIRARLEAAALELHFAPPTLGIASAAPLVAAASDLTRPR